MPANVGEMFYYGKVPWHGEGKKYQPVNMDSAIPAPPAPLNQELFNWG